MSESEVNPQVVSEGDVKMVGPGHDDSPTAGSFDITPILGH